MYWVVGILIVLLPGFLAGEGEDPVYDSNKVTTLPSLLYKVNPKYSEEARRVRVQGTALYSIIIDKSGVPRDIQVTSPMGYGLDDKGVESIQQWKFVPATKNGLPVSVRANIEINFRLEGLSFDSKLETRRTDYNRALHELAVSKGHAKVVETIQRLAAEKFPAAMAMLGEWMIEGWEVPKDFAGGLELVKKAAAKYDGTAIFVLGMLAIKGEGMPVDPERGLKLIREASTYGSSAAQFYLGSHYETGEGVADDPEQARHFFRLCAARGVAMCQFRLGKLLASGPSGTNGDLSQAMAWLQLARDGSVTQAAPLIDSLRAKLSDEDIEKADKLKGQLVIH